MKAWHRCWFDAFHSCGLSILGDRDFYYFFLQVKVSRELDANPKSFL